MKEHNILVGTPAYHGQVHVDYVRSIQSFGRAGLSFDLSLLANESLITRARNEITQEFIESPQYTHLLFLDGDIGLKGEDLAALLDHGKDVIAARVPLKGYDGEGNIKYNTGRELARLNGLSLVTRVGTAVMLLARQAVSDLVAAAAGRGEIYRIHRGYYRSDPDAFRSDVFRVGTRNGEYLSEDFWVCYQLRELGYGIYVDPGICVSHAGMYRFRGERQD